MDVLIRKILQDYGPKIDLILIQRINANLKLDAWEMQQNVL